MKKNTLFIAILFSLSGFAQDNQNPPMPEEFKISHEIGINTTFLVKQMFSLSSSSFTTLPYDLTYKLIRRNQAIRAGVGVSLNNSTVSTSTSGSSATPGPDPIVPTYSKSMNLYYRVGWERRFALQSKVMAYLGLDIIGQSGNSSSQSSVVFNNLPNYYSYSKTTFDSKTMGYGGGPVAGIQLFLTKKLSIFTEAPIYFQYTTKTEKTENYSNFLQSGWGTPVYVSTDDKEVQSTKGSRLTLALPVTIYLSIKI